MDTCTHGQYQFNTNIKSQFTLTQTTYFNAFHTIAHVQEEPAFSPLCLCFLALDAFAKTDDIITATPVGPCHFSVSMRLQSLMLMDKGCQLRVGLSDVSASWDAAPPGANDAVLRWLEHYADALHQRFACARIQDPLSPSICLYPVKPPWQVLACLPSYQA